MVAIAPTWLALLHLRLAITTLLALGTGQPPGEVLALVTVADALPAGAVAMAATVRATTLPCPPEVTDTVVVGGPRALAMEAGQTARLVTCGEAVALEPRVTPAVVGARQVDTGGVSMALMEAEEALVYVRAGEVLPLLQARRAVPNHPALLSGLRVATLHAATQGRVGLGVAPTTPKISQTGGAGGVVGAGVAEL